MRVSINSSIVRLVVDLNEEQVLELMRIAIDKVYKEGSHLSKPVISDTVKVPVKEVSPAPKVTESKVKEVITNAPPVATSEHSVFLLSKQELQSPKEYKGFLYIKCESCGNLKAFMPKTPISQYKCDCGHMTMLQDMKEMYVDCKCGSHFKYLTNAKDSFITILCYNCGAPVDLEYHERRNNYQTIN